MRSYQLRSMKGDIIGSIWLEESVVTQITNSVPRLGLSYSFKPDSREIFDFNLVPELAIPFATGGNHKSLELCGKERIGGWGARYRCLFPKGHFPANVHSWTVT